MWPSTMVRQGNWASESLPRLRRGVYVGVPDKEVSVKVLACLSILEIIYDLKITLQTLSLTNQSPDPT